MENGVKFLVSSGLNTPAENGYNIILDILAEMREQGVDVPPVVLGLVTQLYARAYAAEQSGDRLSSKYVLLQAEHSQLVVEFNRCCRDNNKAWKTKAETTLYDDMQRSVDALVEARRELRGAMKSLFDERLATTTEVVALRKEVEKLRKENAALAA
ncbi:uncharacterized protein F4812DRAFT_440592 [Daldinia caldariorum]|uniref:uncharacterized protein n=1 Tax=Daldinia caldariorum TaxID=326644 RepID=UPI002008079F|nr:uncharacterized protein F4812DRAFT_440592 [Daldinia caldariorum]KAI1464835.1 hypothetical protein F4812DRAFT_440592 [Daldinia caldariorum]